MPHPDRTPREAIASTTPVEAIARALVLALFPTLVAALHVRGSAFSAVMRAAVATARPLWTAGYGADVAEAGCAILSRLMPSAILTEIGERQFRAAGPIADLSAIPPREAIRPATPRGAMRARLDQLAAWLSRRPA